MSLGKKIALCTAAGIAICAGTVCLVAYGIQRSDDRTNNPPSQADANSQTSNQASETGETTTQKRDRIRDTLKERLAERRANRETKEQKTVKLQGKGRQASNKFSLEPGLCVMEFSHDGDENMIVRLLNQKGEEVGTVFNQIGPFSGECGFAVEDGGMYLLDVQADGNWNATLRQPRPNDAESVPQTLTGTGYQTTPFFKLGQGLAIFKINHEGADRFKVELMDRDGNVIGQLVNVLGPFSGSKPIAIEKDDIYFLNVGAGGDWTIDVE